MGVTAAGGWTNWAGNQRATGIQVVHPRGTGEIADAVTRAAAQGHGIRPIGSGHSFTAIGRPRDVQLRLDRHDRLLAVDRESGLVTVESGMPLHRLNQLLDAEGLALTNLGDIDRQTVAGAVSTGTHGTGEAFGGLATQLRALELVTAAGQVLACSADENADLFEHARLGLGALGVLSSVTLQTVPSFALHAHEYPAPLDETLARFDELSAGHDHVEFYWFPHTRATNVKVNTRVPVEAGLAPLSRLRGWWDDDFLSNTVFGGLVATGRRVPAVVRPAARVAAAALGSREFTDVSHRVFVTPRRVRFVEMEYAVPRDALLPLLTELVAAVEASDWRIAVPVEVRTAAADDIGLSTASGRDTGYVAIHVPPGSPDQAAYLSTLERLAAQVGGRPHWGKLHSLTASELRALYPRFDDFVALRDRLDPTGVLANDHLDLLLGPPPETSG
ncbi:D-arabinono-1,4-lactone oxidase [Nocardioides sp. LHG3406-4]|uniref:D-arabinono-1,4-lactone oxidase n=1 Tax=Nocardioides sp. LHG3406-4 TaxID=2804575 RepID=UPI003CF0008F